MFPLFSIIIAFSIALAYPALVTGAPPADYLGIGLTLGLVVLLFRRIAGAAARKALADPNPSLGPVIRAAAILRVLAVAAYGILLYVFHWPAVIGTLGVESWILVDELILLAPYFALLVVSILSGYRAERASRMHDFTPGRYLSFQLRQYLLPVLPLCAFLLVSDGISAGAREGVRWIAELSILYRYYPFVQWVSLAVMLFGLYCFTPFLLKWFWRAKPLPPGPLRERLDRFSEREGFRARDILVWPTGGNVMNAAVIGVAAPVRYVLMTDALIEELPADEVEAVFAHEVGHAKHNHLLLFFLFTVGYALLAYLLGTMLQGRIPAALKNSVLVTFLIGIGGFLVWFGILFGFVSRRFEQQADVFGALSTGRGFDGAGFPPEQHPFVRALEGLGRSMGDLRESKGWRHFSLGDRIAFLKSFLADERVRSTYRRGMTALLAFFFGLLLALGIAAAATVPQQLEAGRIPAAIERTSWLIHHGYASPAVRENHPLRAAPEALLRLAAMRTHEILAMTESPAPIDGFPPPPTLAPRDRDRLRLELAVAYGKLGMLRAARLTLEKLPAEFQDRPGYMVLTGDLLRGEGRLAGAALAYRDALATLPFGHPDAAGVNARLESLGKD